MSPEYGVLAENMFPTASLRPRPIIVLNDSGLNSSDFAEGIDMNSISRLGSKLLNLDPNFQNLKDLTCDSNLVTNSQPVFASWRCNYLFWLSLEHLSYTSKILLTFPNRRDKTILLMSSDHSIACHCLIGSNIRQKSAKLSCQ